MNASVAHYLFNKVRKYIKFSTLILVKWLILISLVSTYILSKHAEEI